MFGTAVQCRCGHSWCCSGLKADSLRLGSLWFVFTSKMRLTGCTKMALWTDDCLLKLKCVIIPRTVDCCVIESFLTMPSLSQAECQGRTWGGGGLGRVHLPFRVEC